MPRAAKADPADVRGVTAQMEAMLARLEEQRKFVTAGANTNANAKEIAYGGAYASLGKDLRV